MGINKQKFIFFALAPTGTGISGGDRIFIELARQWSKTNSVTIYTTSEGDEMVERQNLSGKFLKLDILNKSDMPAGFLFKYIYKIYLEIY